MPNSMTAFSRKTAQSDWGQIIWEIRSVNHRYLEMSMRLPDLCRDLETHIRQQVRQKLNRGKVDIFLKVKNENVAPDLVVNRGLVEKLSEELNILNNGMEGKTTTINLVDLLAWPGVIDSSEQLSEAQKKAILNAFDETLEDLIAHRKREGEELKQFIKSRLEQINQHVKHLQPHLNTFVEDQRTKLRNRITNENIVVDPQRLEQELLIWAQKMDVSEELDRLVMHVKEVDRSLSNPQPVGRQLDFLMQELNREANTLGSKSVNIEATNTSVAIKVLIEQMREQVQNLE